MFTLPKTGLVLVAVQLTIASAAAQDVPAVVVKKIDGTFPRAGVEVIGSGSGVIIGPRHVLTNRHVVEDEDSKSVRAGFRVLTSPDYKASEDARVVAICETYDLAIIETAHDLTAASNLLVLDALPPLTMKVTAFGFPMGSQFGIGLTVTGGQITRHPAKPEDDDSSAAEVAKSVWHDAIIAGGSSGGPLFSERGVLVGVNFGMIRKASGYALSIPATAVASFLRKADVAQRITFVGVNQLTTEEVKYEPAKLTVFVQILDDSTSPKSPQIVSSDVAQSASAAIAAAITAKLPMLSDSEIKQLREGDLEPVFVAKAATDIVPGSVFRVKGDATLIQVLDDGLLLKIDGVLCNLMTSHDKAGELRAKFGTEIVRGIPFDGVFLVGKPVDYTTVAGGTGSYLPLLAASRLVEKKQMLALIDAEIVKRNTARTAQEAAAKKRADEQAAVAFAESKKKLRHTFKDSSGSFSVEAILVKVDGHTHTIQLLRVDSGKLIVVDTFKLCDDDRRWITSRVPLVRTHGAAILEEAEKQQPISRYTVLVGPANIPADVATKESRPVVALPKPLIAPCDNATVRASQAAWAAYLGATVEQKNSVGMGLVLIPPGEFLMGSSSIEDVAAVRMANDTNIKSDSWVRRRLKESPQHRVVLTKPYWLGTTEVTVGQFKKFVDATRYITEAQKVGVGNPEGRTPDTTVGPESKRQTWLAPGHTVTDDLPVTQVTWNDGVMFCNWLSNHEKLRPLYEQDGNDGWKLLASGTGYRLPTEAEWEYACRAGTPTQFSFGDDPAMLDVYAWFNKNSGGSARAVGVKLANGFGLFDMHGNVYEWCQDYYSGDYYSKSSLTDPTGSPAGTSRVMRGGRWGGDPLYCGSAFRGAAGPVYHSSNNGFRVLLAK